MSAKEKIIDDQGDVANIPSTKVAEIKALSQENINSFSKQYQCAVMAYEIEEYDLAVKYTCNAIKLYPLHKDSRELFSFSFYLSQTKTVDDDVRNAFRNILASTKGLNVNLIERCWVAVIKKDDVFGKMISDDRFSDFQQFKKHFEQNAERIFAKFRDPLFLGGLKLQFIPDISIGKFLQNVRRFLLEAFLSDHVEIKLNKSICEDLVLALAHAAFSSDYVWDVSSEEVVSIDKLRQQIISGDRKPEILGVCLIASYGKLASEGQLLSKLSGFIFQLRNKKLKYLLEEQVNEPKKEKLLADGIKSFGPISDPVSIGVREQYEESPYPRWSHLKPLHLDEMAEALNLYSQGKKILIAGSATGEYPINIALSNPHLQVTGVDLSQTSLGYSKRKAGEHKVKNISFFHGDILNIAELGQEFDIIESMGVIHHMKDPMKGLERLLSVLKPKGYIKIGLYSKTARRHIADCQKEIISLGYKPDYSGIRKARELVFAKPEGHPYRKMLEYNDFYNSCMIRDMLFHVQEHCFEIQQIKDFTNKYGLRFMGFSDIDTGQAKAEYAQRFPNDKDMINLDHWADFEKDKPDTFIRMYKFWCKKQ